MSSGSDEAHPNALDPEWRNLRRSGAVAALCTAALIPIQIAVLLLWPPPTSVTDWFSLFHSNPLLGLVDMDLLMIVDVVLLIPILLALFVALRRSSPSGMALWTGLGFVGVFAYFASNPAVQMLSLADKYANATNAADRASYLAAGQALLSNYTGTAFDIYYVLASVALIAISVVMLRTTSFGRVTTYSGIIGNLAALGLFMPTIGVALSVGSVFILEVWYVFLARDLLRWGEAHAIGLAVTPVSAPHRA